MLYSVRNSNIFVVLILMNYTIILLFVNLKIVKFLNIETVLIQVPKI